MKYFNIYNFMSSVILEPIFNKCSIYLHEYREQLILLSNRQILMDQIINKLRTLCLFIIYSINIIIIIIGVIRKICKQQHYFSSLILDYLSIFKFLLYPPTPTFSLYQQKYLNCWLFKYFRIHIQQICYISLI